MCYAAHTFMLLFVLSLCVTVCQPVLYHVIACYVNLFITVTLHYPNHSVVTLPILLCYTVCTLIVLLYCGILTLVCSNIYVDCFLMSNSLCKNTTIISSYSLPSGHPTKYLSAVSVDSLASDLDDGVSASRESAYMYAVNSAGITFTITRACSQGSLSSCGCDKSKVRKQNE